MFSFYKKQFFAKFSNKIDFKMIIIFTMYNKLNNFKTFFYLLLNKNL